MVLLNNTPPKSSKREEIRSLDRCREFSCRQIHCVPGVKSGHLERNRDICRDEDRIPLDRVWVVGSGRETRFKTLKFQIIFLKMQKNKNKVISSNLTRDYWSVVERMNKYSEIRNWLKSGILALGICVWKWLMTQWKRIQFHPKIIQTGVTKSSHTLIKPSIMFLCY